MLWAAEQLMIRANEAKVEWNSTKKQWQVVIQVGEEVIRRPCPSNPQEAADADLRAAAIETAHDEGYEVDDANVSVVR
jgi:hypothetical protein